MEWSYHLLIEDKCTKKNELIKKCFFLNLFLLQIHTHEKVLVLKSANKVD